MSLFENKSALSLVSDFREGKCRVTDCLDAVYAQIDAVDSDIKAYIDLHKEPAYERAEQVDALYKKGNPLPPLAGVPIAIKDNICMTYGRTTCSSKILEHYRSPYNATVMTKLEDHHLIPTGKVNLDEFAMGSSTENSAFFTTKNPWDVTRAPGGSSGGSAAAVASDMAVLSLGSDTGGSIRQPASFCGVVGMKPTYGRVSRYGLVAFASSLDQIGPFSKTVEDTAHLLNVICGKDSLDATSVKQPVPDFTACLGKDIKGLKIGIPIELFGDEIDPGVKDVVSKAIETFKEQGAVCETLSLPSFRHALSAYYIIAPAEASANLARYDGVRYGYRVPNAKNLREMYKQSRSKGFGSEVKRRILIGTFVLSSGYYDAYYLKAQQVRTLIKRDFDKAYERVDVIMSPTCPTTAFGLGENTDDPLSMYLADLLTIPVNLAGLPSISIPCGFSKDMPVGLQLIGPAFDEEILLKAGYAYQQVTNFHFEGPARIKQAQQV